MSGLTRARPRALESIMNRTFLRVGVIGAALATALFVGCGGGGGTTTTAGPPIGAAGGTVTSAEGASVAIPAGALGAPVAIGVAKDAAGAPALPAAPDVQAAGDVFALTPHGTAFAAPATLTLPFDPTKVPAGGTLMLLKTGAAQAAWQPVAGATTAGATMSGSISGFSFVVVAVVFPPTITTQPADQVVASGASATFSVVATGHFGQALLAYQWSSSADGGLTWQAIAGATAASYATPPVLAGSTRYRVNVGLQAAPWVNVDSASATVTIGAGGGSSTPAVAAGTHHSLALKADGTVWAWGRNVQNQLGDGTGVDRTLPVRVQGLPPIAAISAGHYHSLALARDGSVWAWGDPLAAAGGQTQMVAVQVNLAGTFTDIAASDQFSVALRNDGTVWAWGINGQGQLGRGNPGASDSTPQQVSGLSNVVQIDVASNHVVARQLDGTVWAWGGNDRGQIGDGSFSDRGSPFMVPGTLGSTNVVAFTAHSMAFGIPPTTDTAVWGGAVTVGSTSYFGGSNVPVKRGIAFNAAFELFNTDGRPLRAIAETSGGQGAVYVLWIEPNNGAVFSVGANADGVLGDGTTTDNNNQTTALGLVNMQSIATPRALARFAIARKGDGTVWAWGYNGDGQLGDGTTTNRLVPVQVPGLNLN